MPGVLPLDDRRIVSGAEGWNRTTSAGPGFLEIAGLCNLPGFAPQSSVPMSYIREKVPGSSKRSISVPRLPRVRPSLLKSLAQGPISCCPLFQRGGYSMQRWRDSNPPRRAALETAALTRLSYTNLISPSAASLTWTLNRSEPATTAIGSPSTGKRMSAGSLGLAVH